MELWLKLSLDEELRMKRYNWLTIIILILLALTSSCPIVLAAQSKSSSLPPLKPDQVIWAQRVRLVWRMHNSPDYSKAKVRDTENAVLADGRPRAKAELGRLLQERPLSDPLRFQVAFTMGLLDLNYPASRKVLIQYLGEMRLGPPHPGVIDWERFGEMNADPEAPPDERRMLGEDMLGLIFDVYERRNDPVLLSALLDFSPFTDGAGTEVMGVCLTEVTKKHPADLLRALSHKRKAVWQSVYDTIGSDIGDTSPRKTFSKLAQIAKDKPNPLSPLAKRLLKGIEKEQRTMAAQ